MPVSKLCCDPLPTVEAVRDHLWRNRDDLRNCVIGFSGGKDSVTLTKLVHEIEPAVPLLYASTGDAEWPAHLDFVRSRGAAVLETSRGWDWFDRNPWAFLHAESRDAERWAKAHFRLAIRRYSRERGLTLLWGNRTADRNKVPAVRYICPERTVLWMPLRDLTTVDTLGLLLPSDWSPLYDLPSTRESDGLGDRRLYKGVAAADVYRDARDIRHPSFDRFDNLFRRKFGDAAVPAGDKC